MTNKSIRDYINLIENAQQPVAEGSNELYQQAIRKYVQRVANNYLGGGNAHLYGAGNFDSEMFGVDPKQAEKDFDTLFPQYLKQLQSGKQDMAEDGIESWSGNPSDRRHSGHESYMTPEYMLAHYKERLAQIAAGKHKYPKEVAQLQAKIAKLEKQVATEEQLEETTPEALAKIDELTRK